MITEYNEPAHTSYEVDYKPFARGGRRSPLGALASPNSAKAPMDRLPASGLVGGTDFFGCRLEASGPSGLRWDIP